ncbi:MAG: glycerol kinase GlpK [Deltaproteobacteria bacterium]|nr:glycerol kinase GlpK [Deltaproteobacteria bacterium]
MILAIDQGTTSSRAILLDAKGRLIASHSVAIVQHYPKPGWVEHDPKDIWSSVEKSIVGAIRKARISPKKILSIGISNQRETVSLFDGDKPLHRFIVWQDRRTSDECQKLKKFEKIIQKKSGLPVDPYFSSTKIRWLIEKLKISPSQKSIRFRTIESFLISKMSRKDFTEATNASRTSLMNLQSLKWDPELLEIFGIPKSFCPEIISSQNTEIKTKGLHFLPDGIPISGILGDQQAALFGQMGWRAGEGKITFGTGSFILLNAGEKPIESKNSLVSTLAIQWKDRKKLYALEGSAFICGAWIQWLRDELKLIKNSAEIENLAEKVSSSEGVMVIPALSGMGAPFWKPEMRGEILGLTRGSSQSHLARASLEALAFQNRALIDAMKKDSPGLKLNWKVDGGAVKNNLLMQIQADILQSTIIRPKNLEATAFGAGMLSAHALDLIDLKTIEKSWKQERSFKPQRTSSADLVPLYARWLQRVSS